MDKTAIVTLMGSVLGLALACGASDTGSRDAGLRRLAQRDPAARALAAGGGLGSGPGGASGVGALGGIGGGINPDGGSGTGSNPDAACESISQGVQVEKSPVDIVWGVDTSGSMLEESVAVQENVNAFSTQISAAGIDVHVAMLAGYPLCIIPGHLRARNLRGCPARYRPMPR